MANTVGPSCLRGQRETTQETERHCAAVIPEAAKVEGSVKEWDGESPPSFKYHRDTPLHIVQTPNYNVWRRVGENTPGS